MEKKPLTKVQKEVFDFVQSYIKEKDIAPTLSEIASGLDYESCSPVELHINTLCEKGYLKKEPRKWRGISLVQDESEQGG